MLQYVYEDHPPCVIIYQLHIKHNLNKHFFTHALKLWQNSSHYRLKKDGRKHKLIYIIPHFTSLLHATPILHRKLPCEALTSASKRKRNI